MSAQAVPASSNFSLRAVALVIDFAILAGMQFVIFTVGAYWFIQEIQAFDLLTAFAVLNVLLACFLVGFIFLHLTYFIIFHAWFGQTIGKMIMGIKVIAENDGGVSTAVAFLRWVGYILSALPLAAGFLWSAVDKDHCSWHDRLAGTRVVAIEMT